jgi:hypothetical protein
VPGGAHLPSDHVSRSAGDVSPAAPIGQRKDETRTSQSVRTPVLRTHDDDRSDTSVGPEVETGPEGPYNREERTASSFVQVRTACFIKQNTVRIWEYITCPKKALL